jgi:RHS repeat-associated protein
MGIEDANDTQQNPETSDISEFDPLVLKFSNVPQAASPSADRNETIEKLASDIIQQNGELLSRLVDPEAHAYTVQDAITVIEETAGQYGVELTSNDILNIRNYLNSLGEGATQIIYGERMPSTAADPITMYSGEFVHENEDLKIDGAGIDFVFRRTYRSQSFSSGPLGFKWDHSYNLWLRISEDGFTIFRTTGQGREEVYYKHPKFDQSGFEYYLPKDGQQGVVLQGNNNIFIWRSPHGDRFVYEKDPRYDVLYRIVRIQDMNGEIGDDDHSNYLNFSYSESYLLDTVSTNHQKRQVKFYYDEQDRIEAIQDYFGDENQKNRIWRYSYDDYGDLEAVTTPSVTDYPSGLTTSYEYSSSIYSSFKLQHNLISITDPCGRTFLENEYGDVFGFLDYNRVVKQRQGMGEWLFSYENVIQEFDRQYSELERPVYQTNSVERNGHQVHYIYNMSGNLLMREEHVLQKAQIELLRWRYRYNKDGLLIAIRTPEGRITQYYYGRDDYLRQKGISEEDVEANPDLVYENLSMKECLSFGNVLSVVRRSRQYDFVSQLNLRNGVWGNTFPDIISDRNTDASGNLQDIVTKYTYEEDYQRVKTVSDPRFTLSAEPGDQSENEEYQETIIIYVYGIANENSNLKSIIYPNFSNPDGSTVTDIVQRFNRYDDKGRIQELLGLDGTLTRFTYYKDNTIKDGYLKSKTVDPDGINIITSYGVNNVGIVNAIKNPRGFQTSFEINNLDQVVRVTSPSPFRYETKLHYDKNLNLCREEREIKDAAGSELSGGTQIKRYIYDEENNLTQHSLGGRQISTLLTTHYQYNESDKLTRTVSPKGNYLTQRYDERLYEIKRSRGVGSSDISNVTTIYSADGLPIKEIDGLGNVTIIEYDAFGRPIKTVDPLGNVALVKYDKAENVTFRRFFEKRSSGKYALLSRSISKYNERNFLITFRNSLFSSNDLPLLLEDELETSFLEADEPSLVLETSYYYDKVGRMSELLNPKGQKTSFEYDAANRRTKITDAAGNYTKFAYDNNGNVIRKDIHEKSVGPSGSTLTEEVFSALYEYDELERLTSVTDSLGNKSLFYYDSLGAIIGNKDGLNNIKLFNYDVYGRLVSHLSYLFNTGIGNDNNVPDKTIKRFEYDKDGNRTSAVDENGNRTVCTYDALNRLKEIIQVDDSTQYFEYDTEDNITVYRDNNGLIHNCNFDAAGRLIRRQLDFSGLDPIISKNIERFPTFEKFSYDGLGNVKRKENDLCTIRIFHDSLGRPEVERLKYHNRLMPSALFVIKRRFDEVGNLIELTYPSKRKIKFILDNLGNVIKVKNIAKGRDYPGSRRFSDQYDIVTNTYTGRFRKKATYGNGSYVVFARDKNNRMIEIAHTLRNGSLKIQQLHDSGGNIRLKNEISPRQSFGEIYKYNSVYWLSSKLIKNARVFNAMDFGPANSEIPSDSISGQDQIDIILGNLEQLPNDITYEYDPVGNRRISLESLEAATYKTNDLNQYASVDGIPFQYDRNGNLINDGNYEYSYNYQNLLSNVYDVLQNRSIAKFSYDVEGRRIYSEMDSKTMIYDNQNILEEYRNGKLHVEYVSEYGIDNFIQIATEGDEHWYHKDFVSSCRLLSNANGNISGVYRYLPFGTMEHESGPYNPVRYMSKLLDEVTGLYNFRSRTYHPKLGRFLQRDTIRASNLYTFVDNNPLNFVDKIGRDKSRADDRTLLDKVAMYNALYAGTNVPVAPFTDEETTRLWNRYPELAQGLMDAFEKNRRESYDRQRKLREAQDIAAAKEIAGKGEAGINFILKESAINLLMGPLGKIGGHLLGRAISRVRLAKFGRGAEEVAEVAAKDASETALKTETAVEASAEVSRSGTLATEAVQTATSEVAQVQVNRTAGNAFRDEIYEPLVKAFAERPGHVVRREVYKRTPFGGRVSDIHVEVLGDDFAMHLGGIETKLGGSRYLPAQRLKDMWLTRHGYPVNVVRGP